ncbi:MAG: CBS domain-containing protein [Anaerolineales bacterium]|nr:CBS domain-containing protein [Anaerolineales bacterium]
MNTVGQILKAKGSTVWTITKDAPVSEALKHFADHGIGSVVVMDGEVVAGIFSERDFARRVGLLGKEPEKVKVEEVMTRELITVSPKQSVNACMALMTEHRVRHLPVFEEGRLVGILSIGDVVKDLIEELQFMVKQLENYIQGMR